MSRAAVMTYSAKVVPTIATPTRAAIGCATTAPRIAWSVAIARVSGPGPARLAAAAAWRPWCARATGGALDVPCGRATVAACARLRSRRLVRAMLLEVWASESVVERGVGHARAPKADEGHAAIRRAD